MSYDFFKRARDERIAEGLPVLSQEESERRKQAFLSSLPPKEDVWFFGYGSLMWDPGFHHLEAAMVRLQGWHRSFCVLSHGYRGTVNCPGLVLGLDEGGECAGMAYRVCGRTQLEEAVEYLWVREMVTGIYNPTQLPAHIDDGRTVPCWAFVVDRGHRQYMGHLSQETRAAMIAEACGTRGPNRIYLENTVARLQQLGVDDESLTAMLEKVCAASGLPEG